MELEKFYYDNKIVRNFAYATVIWGAVGMLVGLWVALQLVFPSLNITQYFSFGRLRPLHTNAVIFAFVGNGLFMTSVHKPVGLIRYASENSIVKGVKLKFTTRIKAYTAVLSLLLSLLVFLLVSRTDLDARLMRTAGMTYTSLPDGRISNLYNLKLANKTHADIPFTLKLENINGEIEYVGSSTLIVKKEDYSHLQFFVKLNRNDVKNWKTELQIGMYENSPQGTVPKKIKTITAKFIGPEIYN